MFLVDTDEHRIIEDEEIKAELAAEHPYDEWLHAGLIHLDDLPEREHIVHTHASVTRRQQIFGYTEEELRVLLTPMANDRRRADRLDGHRHPDRRAVASKPRLLFDYFSQLFAQVTNPPLDAIREELVTSLPAPSARRRNLLEPAPASCRQVVLPFPVIDNDELAKIRHINRDGDMPGFITHVVPRPLRRRGRRRGDGRAARRDLRRGVRGDRRRRPDHRALRPALRPPSSRRSRRCCSPARCTTTWSARRPAPRSACSSRPATSARCTTSPCSIGYGAAAVNPYLAMESVEDLARDGYYVKVEPEKAVANLIKALGKGVLKVMSQDGRLHGRVLHRRPDLRGGRPVAGASSTSTSPAPTSKLGGVEPRRRSPRRSRAGTPRPTRADGIAPAHRELEIGGEYQWRREGEPHLFDPETVFRLQHSTRSGRYDIFKQYTARVDEQSERLMTLRGLFRFKDGDDAGRSRSRSTRSSRSPRSSSGSPPARCPTARSARRRTRPSPSR